MECQPALRYRSPTAAKRESKTATRNERGTERGILRSWRTIAKRQLQSLRRETSLTHQLLWTKPLNSDLLKRLVRNGAMTPTTALRCVVGSGSSAQVLSGNARTAAMTSLTVTDWNWLNVAVEGFVEKRRRRGVVCCGSHDSDSIIKVKMKLRSVNVSRHWRFTATQQCINWPPQLARLIFLCFDLGLSKAIAYSVLVALGVPCGCGFPASSTNGESLCRHKSVKNWCDLIQWSYATVHKRQTRQNVPCTNIAFTYF